MKLRHRRGTLLIEVMVTILIAGMAIFGFGYFFAEITEQMRIAWQLRDVEEYGHYYVDQFREKVRNGYDLDIQRETPPAQMSVKYVDPWDPLQLEHTYSFQYHPRMGIPVIMRDGVRVDYPNFPPPSPSGRDEVLVDSRSFEIYKDRRIAPGGIDPRRYDENFRPYYVNIEFTMRYRRQPLGRRTGVYEIELPFSSGAWVMNVKWRSLPQDTTGTQTSL